MTTYLSSGDRVTFTRRFFGDNWLEGLLQFFTLGIGWLVWFAVVAPKGTTPAKQLLNVRVHDYRRGVLATSGQMWMREVVGKLLIPFAIAFVGVVATASTSGGNVFVLYFLVSDAMILFSDDQRGIWDHIAGTVVRYHQDGYVAPPIEVRPNDSLERRLQELELLRARGAITEDEYRERRQDIVSRI